mgnify:CR=1 FL=1
MKKRGFIPEEIIFSATTSCNLHCPHCFIIRKNQKLDIPTSIKFLKNCATTPKSTIQRIGFSGGEPFLYFDFILALTKCALELDLLFDQIITNGDWWKSPDDLKNTLQTLYNAGYDGKIALSWDSYHAQKTERMEAFISAVQEIFGQDSINIQAVEGRSLSPGRHSVASTPLTTGDTPVTPPDSSFPPKEFIKAHPEIPVYYIPRCYQSNQKEAWQAKKWFKDDFCQGPGNLLFVHPDGNIAPCCGFANENPALFIGTIHDSFETIMQKASTNPMIKICYQEGLSHYRRHGLKKCLRSQGKKLPGTTGDICTLCDFACKLSEI